MYLLANILLLSGICFFIVSFFTVQQLVTKLPLGEVRNNWKILSFFIVGFIVGFIVYLFMLWTGKITLSGITIPVISFSAAAFVLLLCFLTYQTTRDIRDAIAMDQASIVDPILDIYNRRYFDRRIDEETQRSRRYKLPLSLVLFEVDEFNNIINQHGRLVGDVVLRKVSDLIVNTVRSSDIVARFDAQKIVVATTQTEADMTIKLADRLLAEIENLEILPNGGQDETPALHVTASAGVSSVVEEIKDGFDLVEIAEKALQQADKQGQNKVYALDPADIESIGEVAEATAA